MLRRGEFIAFQGYLGAGKTLTMTRLGAMLYRAGHIIYANYPCVYARPIESLVHLFSLRNAIVMIDEVQSLLDARRASSNKNLDISQWIVIVRKLGLSVLYTTQYLGQVDVRVRNITNWVYCCEQTSLYGCPATKCTILRWYGEAGRVRGVLAYPHTAALYRLYDSFDYRVELTSEGRVATFDESVAVERIARSGAARRETRRATPAADQEEGADERPVRVPRRERERERERERDMSDFL